MQSAERSRPPNVTTPCHNHRQQITSSQCPRTQTHESVADSEELNLNKRTNATLPTRRTGQNLDGVTVHQLYQLVNFFLTSDNPLGSKFQRPLQHSQRLWWLKYLQHTHSLSHPKVNHVVRHCQTNNKLLHHAVHVHVHTNVQVNHGMNHVVAFNNNTSKYFITVSTCTHTKENNGVHTSGGARVRGG